MFDYAVSPIVDLTANMKNMYASRQSSTQHTVNLDYSSYSLPVGWSFVNLTSNAVEIGRSSIYDSVSYTNLVLYEVVCYGAYLSDSQSTQVLDYLNAKWAMSNTAATPTLSLASGAYPSAQTVSISTLTPGATIYYTTDGSVPTTSSAVYSSPVNINSSVTIRAMTSKSGLTTSSVASGAYVIDTTAPTATISTSAASTTNVTPIPVTITFSESVTGFIDADVTVTNGTKSGFSGSGTTYTMNVTPSTQGAVTVNVAANAAQDSAGNNNTAATQLSRIFDSVAPTVAITSSPASGPTNNSAMTLTFTFSEGVTGFTASDVSLTNATAGSFTTTNSSVYTLAITATGSAVSASVPANSTIDSASNGNIASTPWSIVYDNSVSAPTFNPPPGAYSGEQSLTLTSSTSGSTIYYTIDGSTPTTTSSIFTAAINISKSTTIKAIAVKSGSIDSSLTTADYTVYGALPVQSNLNIWLDASDAATLFQDSAGTVPASGNGNPVARWLDKSGGGRHFTQSTAASAPI
jgi:hypothetical protein